MSDNNVSFVFFKTFADSLAELPDDMRLRFYDAITNYALYGDTPKFKGIEKAIWIQIAFAIDETKSRRSASKTTGAKGGRPQKSVEAEEITRVEEEKPSNDEVVENPEKTEMKKRFVKPSVEEVTAYIQEQNLNVDVQKFVNYYESNGWKVGRSSMKDWKAACRNWNSNQYQKPVNTIAADSDVDVDFWEKKRGEYDIINAVQTESDTIL